MKKLFTLLFATATVAAFAAAPVQQKVSKQQPQALAAERFDARATMGEKVGSTISTKAISPKAVTDPIDTLYLEPKGSFYSAFFPYETPTGGSSFYYRVDRLLIPGGVENTWRNITSGSPESFTWVWYNAELDPENYQISTDKDLVTNWRNTPASLWYAPSLYVGEVTTGNETFYRLSSPVQYGGKMEYDIEGDGSILTNMQAYSPVASYRYLMSIGSAASGKNNDTVDADAEVTFWPEMLDEVEGADFAEVKAQIQLLDKPARPYAFSRIQMYAYAHCKAGDVITVKVCPAANGIDIDNPIATAEYEFAEDNDGETVTALDFYFEDFNAAMGLTEEKWITVDDAIALVFEGGDQMQSFYPVVNGIHRDYYLAHDGIYESHAVCLWYFYKDGTPIDAAFYNAHGGYFWGNAETGSKLVDHFQVSFNAQFAYIENDETAAVTDVITAETTAGTADLTLRASEPSDAWVVDENNPDWVDVVFTDNFDEDEDLVNISAVINYQALPAGTKGRTGTLKYELPGTVYTIVVNQGDVAGDVVAGDVNGDGVLSAADITALYNFLLNGDDSQLVNGDQNGDGQITAADVTAVYTLMLDNQ